MRARRGGDSAATVPEAELRSYYGQPVLKPPIWHVPHMPVYLYLGGLSGASSVIAAAARLSGHDRLALAARVTAFAGAGLGSGFLVAELGRPERFLNMLRVFKVTSPMSVGSWTLAAHSGLTAAGVASAVTGLLPVAGDAAVMASALTGPVMATYTGVLLADTAVPAWHAARRELPFLFAGSALASAGAVGMLTTPRAEAAPARAAAALGAVMETTAAAVIERRLGLEGEPYQQGRAGLLMKTSRALILAGGLLATVAGRSRALTAASGLALTAGALCTRFGMLEAGKASALDPKYTVVPQRERAGGRRLTVVPDRDDGPHA
ncbi:NrfD/PsrC family molybdoenzyme membrane anchor subunit [Planotetraspora kaengkrachanensis]|uniref:Polysulfide reductase n=1 Tax=Planotetraspora kaengkrachanensis TaxID=575193 RepID=A0A8J3VB09_9ACTN|nr:NrfD/PsrC family molybdoenzyme membrane anchor subunit [Planotetraspora kaengkrachanensis]GIG83623.1 polysulfide reductase [Planotetraspora kaengkrachanensis]